MRSEMRVVGDPSEDNRCNCDSNIEHILEQVRLVQEKLGPYFQGDDASSDADKLPEQALQDVSDSYRALYDLRHHLPKVMGWCVVKHYWDHIPGDWAWKPAVWVACTNKAQAEALAPLIEDHYCDGAPKHRKNHDTFKVEFREASVHQFLRPDVTAQQYVDQLPRR